MGAYSGLEEKRKQLVRYIRNNPTATYKKIKEDTKIKVERVLPKGMKDVYRAANIPFPKALRKRTKDQMLNEVIEFIRNNPTTANTVTIKRGLGIHISRTFKTIKKAYNAAGVKYKYPVNKGTRKERKQRIIELIKSNPSITVVEIYKRSHLKPYNYFKSVYHAYNEGSIKKIKREEKRKQVINYIKSNTNSTQRKINLSCRTHVQELFNRGIFEAYNKARVKYPFSRLKKHGTTIKRIKDRANRFEETISNKLSAYGKVKRNVRTKRGIADVILETKNKKIIVEIKDYRHKEISVSQVNQLNMYLEDVRCNFGLLICHKKPKRDYFTIGENKIFIISKEEINKIGELLRSG